MIPIEEATKLVSQISSQGLNAQTILLAMIALELNKQNTIKDNTNGSTKRRKGEISEG